VEDSIHRRTPYPGEASTPIENGKEFEKEKHAEVDKKVEGNRKIT
jgi:hypothetical protein